MKEKHDVLGSIIGFVISNPYKVVLASLMLSIYGGMLATDLDIETDFSNLIPEDYPSIVALEKIRNTVGGEGSDVAVGIISPSFEASKAFAEDLIPRAMAMTRGGEPYLRSVEYRRETEFLSENALYFATDEELSRMETYLEEELEEANLEANPFYFDLDEGDENEVNGAENAEEEDLEEFEDLYNWLVGNEYPIHDDSTSMTLRFFPAGSQTNVRFIDALYGDMEELIAELNPKSYHPEMETVLAGRLMHRSIQVQAIRKDVAKTFGIGASAVLLIVILYFLYKSYYARSGGRFSAKILFQEILRLPVLILVIGIPLLMSLTWTFGTAALIIGNLNLMTSTLALLLFGLGIDFGVHYYGRYSEERASGKVKKDAAELTFKTTGKAVLVAASTTAAALFVLMIADFRGFSEFGFIAGIGIIFAIIAMLLVMPAVITIFENLRLLNLNVDGEDVVYGGVTGRRFPAARSILAFSIIAAILSLIFLPRVSFEYNFDKLDPSYPEYAAKKAIVDGSSSARRGSNPAYVVADSQEEASRIADHLEEMASNNPNTTTIENVQTLQERYPLEEEEIEERLQHINDIRGLLARPFFADNKSEEVVKLKKASQTTNPIALEDVPDYLKDMFETQSGELGTFVMIYPGVELSDGRQSIAFANEVGKIELDNGNIYHASSTSIIAADMLKLMQREAPWMVGLVFIIIIAIMLNYFRSFKWAMLALLPLTFGLLWMLLTMELMALKLNFFNLVVLPAIIGIANDDGIHIASRYREKGKGSIVNVLRSTGEHCVIGTLTTMVGFIGLLFSFHPGLRSIGQLALIGVITTLLAAMLFLPALAQWLEDKDRI